MDVEKLSVDGFNLNISDAKARDMISDKYDPDNGTYVVGDTCINDDILYICNTDIDTPETFDSSKWDADTVGHYCSELKSNLTELDTAIAGRLKLTQIRAVATWNVGSSYTFTDEDWAKYTEFHVYISHANVQNPSYYEIVFNKYFFSFSRIVGYGSSGGSCFVQMEGNGSLKRITLSSATVNSATYNPLIGIYAR